MRPQFGFLSPDRNKFCRAPVAPAIQWLASAFPVFSAPGRFKLGPSAMPACTLELKTIPQAPRDAITGWLGNALKVKVRAPALEGRATEALLAFLAGQLGVPRRGVILIRGGKSQHKVVRIEGLSLEQVKARLRLAPGEGGSADSG